MPKYTWDKSILQNILNNPDASFEMIDAFEFLMKGHKIDASGMSKKEIIGKDYIYLSANDFTESYLESILLSYPMYFGIKPPHTFITVKGSLDNMLGFISTLPVEIKELLLELYSKRAGRLYACTSFAINRFTGHCYLSSILKEYLIDFCKTNNLSMNSTLVHEYGHALGFALRDYKALDYTYHAFSEVESIFIELLFYEYLEKNYRLKNAALVAQSTFSDTICDSADIILNKFDYAYVLKNMIEKGKDFNLLSLKAAVDDTYGYEQIRTYLKSIMYPAEDYLPYVYSYLIAIELLKRYHDDPAYAFALYKKIAGLEGQTANEKNDTLLNLGIIPGENYESYIKGLARKLKR